MTDQQSAIAELTRSLRPQVSGSEQYRREVKQLNREVGEAMYDEVKTHLVAGGVTAADLIRIILRYRLTLAAGFAILEEQKAIRTGTYDRLKRSKRPSQWLAEYVALEGIPDAAEEVSP